MQGILVRIGVDHSYGGWNAPVDPASGRFVYVPIPEADHVEFHPGCARPYSELEAPLHDFAAHAGQDLFESLRCPAPLLLRSMHLDPDYEHLTYGDVGDRRGSQISKLGRGDLLVFYSGLRPCTPCDHRLIYAIVGLYVIDEIVRASDVPASRIHENAHTRKTSAGASDIVVRATPGVSGRLTRCLPIGEYRDRAYRVRRDLLDEWGGLSVNDGYIQRSARPPRFLDAPRFMRWFEKHSAGLVRANNPGPASDAVVVVHLRRPKAEPGEMRSDPFFEFGSFGCTGCHSTNLMHPDRIHELEGVRLAFAQGGGSGFRLVLLTPPVRAIKHADRCELRWEPVARPFRYDRAPLLIDNEGNTDFPLFKRTLVADRNTWCQTFSSLFRTRRRPLPNTVARELIETCERLMSTAEEAAFARIYAETMPTPPNTVDPDRKGTYERLLKRASGKRPGRRRC